MSHHVYTTAGLVLALRSSKESDKTATIFTRDLGLIHATARGMNKGSSRLSASLLDLSLVKISLVRGKRLWRVTTVTLIKNIYAELRERRESLSAIARILSLLSVLVRGEDKNPELYDELERGLLEFLSPDIEGERVQHLELFVVSRMLYHLGYLAIENTLESIEAVAMEKKKFIDLVNEGIRASGL